MLNLFKDLYVLLTMHSKKGWHERNGGNLSYRIKPEEIEEIKI